MTTTLTPLTLLPSVVVEANVVVLAVVVVVMVVMVVEAAVAMPAVSWRRWLQGHIKRLLHVQLIVACCKCLAVWLTVPKCPRESVSTSVCCESCGGKE